MKNSKVRILLAVVLVMVVMFTMAACGEKKNEGPTTDVSKYDSGDGWPTVNEPLTWDAINEFEIVHDGMTVEEGRELVVDFFRYCKTALWIPSETYEYKIKEKNAATEMINGGTIYGGLPYISLGGGSIYRLMDYMDEETNVVDMKGAGANPKLFGNQCSASSYWGIGRVINSAEYCWTKEMVVSNGFVKVGDYIFDETATKYGEGYNTTAALAFNGPDRMYECYAQLQAGDVIVYYTTAGHVVMITDVHVERDDKGVVIPSLSYVTVIDQYPTHLNATNAAGDNYQYEGNVDAKWDFVKLFNNHYIPFTFKEWTGEDPIESSKTEFSYTGDTISLEQLYGSTVTSNYGIGDIYASFYNAEGVEVYKVATRAERVCLKSLTFVEPGSSVKISQYEADATENTEEWGKVENLEGSGEITVKIYAQISTGERPVLWEGKLEK